MVSDTDLERLAAFMAERHAIYMRKMWIEEQTLRPSGRMSSRMREAWGPGYGAEWTLDRLTDDPILARYRFCNVYRELDRVTVWIRENIREPFAEHEHLWFMLAVARHINWPDTLAELIAFREGPQAWPYTGGFTPDMMTEALTQRQARGDKVYTGAYMIRAEQHDRPWRHWPKVRYSAEVVLGKLWEHRAGFSNKLSSGSTLQHAWELFQDPHYTGWGPFMAQQVVADLRWTRYLRNAPDRDTWTHMGPGSARGLNRLHGRPVLYPLRAAQALEEFTEIREWMSVPGNLAPWLDVPIMMDVSSLMCEADKYWRVQNGEGRPRAVYVPGRHA